MLPTEISDPPQSVEFNHIAPRPDLQLQWADVQRDRLQMALLPYDEAVVYIFCCWVVSRPLEDLLSLTLIPSAPTC